MSDELQRFMIEVVLVVCLCGFIAFLAYLIIITFS